MERSGRPSNRTKAQTEISKGPYTVRSTSDPATFMNFDSVSNLETLRADIVILGVPHGQPYTADKTPNDQSKGPAAIGAASRSVSDGLERWDFDLGGTLFNGRDLCVVDCGDVRGDPSDAPLH